MKRYSRVLKFQFAPGEDQMKITLNEESVPVYGSIQNGVACIWVQCGDTPTQVERTFIFRGTGHRVRPNSYHFASHMSELTGLVFHFFEIKEQHDESTQS